MIVADSDVLIDALRGKEPARGRIALELTAGRLATTAVNVFELCAGARTEQERNKVDALLGALSVLSLDDAAARDAAALRRELEAKGTRIGTADYLIAGICRTRGAMLITFNRDHLERVPGLRLSDLAREKRHG